MSRDDAFWAKVDKSGDCWLWTGAKSPSGYGHLTRDGRTHDAHRYSLTLISEDGMTAGGVVDHVCHNRACVRPEHLRSVTPKQNQEHRLGAQRNSMTGVRGVGWRADQKRWRARVKHNGVEHARLFESFDDACAWAKAIRLELFTHNDADRAIA